MNGKKCSAVDARCCLVVEDNIYALDIMMIFLKRHGFSVDSAENGRLATEKYRANPEKYAIIFMDLQMPVMGGYEAAQIIRESGYPTAKSVPIVAMSGDPLENLYELGFNRQLKKPFEMKMVLEILNDLLAN